MGRNSSASRQQLAVKNYFHRDLVGDIQQDYERDRFQVPSFLTRNLRRALAFHERRLSRLARSNGIRDNMLQNNTNPQQKAGLDTFQRTGTKSSNPATPSFITSNQTSAATTGQVLSDVVGSEGDDPILDCALNQDPAITMYKSPFASENLLYSVSKILSLDVQTISTKRKYTRTLGEAASHKPQQCSCEVSIWKADGDVLRQKLFTEFQSCELIVKEYKRGGRVIEIELERPFEISVDLLQSKLASQNLYACSFENCHLEINILPAEHGLKWPPIPLLPKTTENYNVESDGFQGTSKDRALLVSYDGLPKLPDSKKPLPVMYLCEGRLFKTQFGLQIGARWESKDASNEPQPQNPLRRRVPAFNHRKISISGPTIDAIPKTKSKELPIPVQVCYTLEADESRPVAPELRTVELRGFCCMFCTRKNRQYETLQSLQFHLIMLHHRNEIVLVESKNESAESGPAVYKFTVSSVRPAQQKDKWDIGTPGHINWNAPKMPFNMEAYLKGDHSWLQVKQKPRENGGEIASDNPLAILRKRNQGFLPAEFVQDIPQKVLRRHRVVATRTRDELPLFTSVSHKQLRLSEEPLSESDDEVDETWLRDKHTQQISEMEDISETERDFRNRWNDHRRSEGLGHTKYQSDSLIRWARKDRDWIRADRDRLKTFSDFMIKGLKARKVINDQVVRDCFLIIFPRTLKFLDDGTDDGDRQAQRSRV